MLAAQAHLGSHLGHVFTRVQWGRNPRDAGVLALGPAIEEGPGCGPIWVPRSVGEREASRTAPQATAGVGDTQKAGPKPTADRRGADWVAPNLQ